VGEEGAPIGSPRRRACGRRTPGGTPRPRSRRWNDSPAWGCAGS